MKERTSIAKQEGSDQKEMDNMRAQPTEDTPHHYKTTQIQNTEGEQDATAHVVVQKGNEVDYIPKVSVIIPVYNTEKYLRQCLDSVVNQTLKDIEIICVNDGSTDNSLEILLKYAEKDSRIVVVNQKNQGLSRTRNNALKIARGKYVSFLDSDDWLTGNALELLYEYSSRFDLDMVNFEGRNYDESNGRFFRLSAQIISYISEEKEYYTADDISHIVHKIPISSCRFFYKTEFLIENSLVFPEGLFYEDNLFVLNALSSIKRYGIIRKVLYNRTVRGTSITQNWSLFFNDYIEIIRHVAKLVRSQAFFQTTSHHVLSNYLTWSVNIFKQLPVVHQCRYRRRLYRLHEELSNDFRLPKESEDFLKEVKLHDFYARCLRGWYLETTGRFLNLDNPETFNEKIQWLKLYDSTPTKTRLSDKYLVREWVKEKIGEKYLIPLLGVYDRFEDIDFDKLPDQFVIKCNHGSGYNIVVKDKSQLDLADAKQKVDRWMHENYAFRVGFELHYRDIVPKIIIEQYVTNDGQNLYDYKFWCFNGEVKYMQFRDDFSDNLKMVFYDLSWKRQPFYYDHPLYEHALAKPDNFDEMVWIAKTCCQGFPFVCVDLYRLNDGTIKFGEMTFTRSSGSGHWNNEKYNVMMGRFINLPELAYDIDTGEYYKLEKKSRLAPYLCLLSNWHRRHCLSKITMSLYTNFIQNQLRLARIDIKNIGTEGNAVVVETQDGTVATPGWFRNAQGAGAVLLNSAVKGKLKILIIRAGKLTISFMGPDRRFEGERFPAWIDYKAIKINGEEILSSSVETWHDKPLRYEMPVKDGQNVWVEYEQQPHLYSRKELKETILKLNSGSKVVRKNVDMLTDEIEQIISHAKYPV